MAIWQRQARRFAGVTLTEMLLVVSVTSILLGLGIPSFGNMLRSTRLSSVTNELLVEFNLARSEAIRRGQRVVLCKAVHALKCSASGGWEQGWLMFEDANNNAWLDEGETVVRFRPALPPGWQITGNASVSRYVSYHPLGGTYLTGGGFQAGTLTICLLSPSNTPSRQIVINSTGRPRTQVQPGSHVCG
ncbi:GspH/FimT family pseudopilin [uncultured Hydrogenophaga sp.]|uniref:GspH/FimT family pseudopilin n=1 Tax=uncultured Hydrogenophaga sp. TaxID=199683 RepID=UPI002585D917|nr:GspH/FimT family pseudopilin [uncultured Hydrogenophaga sp.]